MGLYLTTAGVGLGACTVWKSRGARGNGCFGEEVDGVISLRQETHEFVAIQNTMG